MNSARHILKYLDLTDLYIMRYFLEEHTYLGMSKLIYITPPAICHRVNKYKDLFGSDIFEERKAMDSRLLLSEKGHQLFKSFEKILSRLEKVVGNG